jgi:hydrogenase expression/formation protein HypD
VSASTPATEFDQTLWRDPALAQRLVSSITAAARTLARLAGKGDTEAATINIMEVCGTHTMSIAKNGLRSLMPENIALLSGPGCPVCVTANADIDTAIELASNRELTITSFGDMMKVPGSRSSLSLEKSAGADVRVVYSPLDALTLAEALPERQVVFIGVGFETTAPAIAATIKRADEAGVKNFSVFSAHKTVPAALRSIASDPQLQLSGLLLPGHVSTIIGSKPYRFLADEFNIPGVITGFEPVDILQGIYLICQQRIEMQAGKAAQIELAYRRGAQADGNPKARALMYEVFEPADAPWRGLGTIAATGLRIRKRFASFDARRRFEPQPAPPREVKGCECGDILRGIKRPDECRLFARSCRPEHPIGPCMVSSEGSCAAYYRYGITTTSKKGDLINA